MAAEDAQAELFAICCVLHACLYYALALFSCFSFSFFFIILIIKNLLVCTTTTLIIIAHMAMD